jgi:putative PIN family toxin of toxin-antitoxin system
MPKVVLDTNVLVSTLHFGGRPREVLDLARHGHIELVISSFILEETEKVLRENFRWEERILRLTLSRLKAIATMAEASHRITVIKEKDADNRILECAVAGGADFLVSGDNKHLLPLREFQGIRILRPADFLTLLKRGE